MKIERKYYTESVKERYGIEKELQKIQESMTEEEKEKSRQEFERLMEGIKRKQARTRHVMNKTKKAYFHTMILAGLELAKVIEADFTAECDEKYGKICFITGMVFFGLPSGQSGKDELAFLLHMADHVVVYPKGDIMEWKFIFQLFDTFVV